jgi:hypothetical protein
MSEIGRDWKRGGGLVGDGEIYGVGWGDDEVGRVIGYIRYIGDGRCG